MEYYAAIKENEIISFAATWVDLEIIILSELMQEQKTKYHMFSCTSEANIEYTWIQRQEQLTWGPTWGWEEAEDWKTAY